MMSLQTPSWMKENIRLIRFLAICLAGYLLWITVYHLWLEPSQTVDRWLSGIEAQEVSWLLNRLGYPVTCVLELGFKQAFYMDNQRLIGLASSCNGLVLFPLFCCFIIATQGTWNRKLVYCLLGSFLIYHVNILRILGLTIIKIYSPQSLDFNHKYTFTVMVYSFIFFLWYLWINFYSAKTKKVHD